MFTILDNSISFTHNLQNSFSSVCQYLSAPFTYAPYFHQVTDTEIRWLTSGTAYWFSWYRKRHLISLTKGVYSQLSPVKPRVQAQVCLLFCFLNPKGQSSYLLLVKDSWGEICSVRVYRFGNGFKKTTKRCSEPSLRTKCQLEGRYKMPFLPVIPRLYWKLSFK